MSAGGGVRERVTKPSDSGSSPLLASFSVCSVCSVVKREKTTEHTKHTESHHRRCLAPDVTHHPMADNHPKKMIVHRCTQMNTDEKQPRLTPRGAGACPASRGRAAKPTAFREGGMAAARSRAFGHPTLPEPGPSAPVNTHRPSSAFIRVHPRLLHSFFFSPHPRPSPAKRFFAGDARGSTGIQAHKPSHLCFNPVHPLQPGLNGDKRNAAPIPAQTISLVSTIGSTPPAPGDHIGELTDMIKAFSRMAFWEFA